MFKSLEMLRCIPECNTEIKYINLLNLTVAKATKAVVRTLFQIDQIPDIEVILERIYTTKLTYTRLNKYS